MERSILVAAEPRGQGRGMAAQRGKEFHAASIQERHSRKESEMGKSSKAQKSPPHGLGAGKQGGSFAGPLSGGKAGAGSGGGSVRGGAERMDGKGLPDSKMGSVRPRR